ncbi:DUF1707 SHOCT-like domain-containing protein [Micromonospora yangpuensis]|uniref:Cell wall-active antibiotics response 4TMS YvqF n=1 Tax=Micromonospora yangpuensis TaxID=683228 RepID=A0A1C6UXN8_9ACTN|nr:DUF1707 domain-containing protein [Micromonospora yangpuensis]GGL94514.1 hypothetical protein GCM10012279_09920 [Micromonospora yangpuensis]SCL58716.1 Cell wall-active antibiotics response 4TMS YvqF [Micromonospora yangpuensis]
MEPERYDDTDRLRVSDREREEVVQLLGQAAAEGRLTLDEYADRVGEAHASLTRGELTRVTRNLPDAPGRAVARPADVATERLLAVFGSEVRKGAWALPEHIEARAIFGDCRIELHETELHRRVITINAEAIFGSVTVVVPEGTDVRLTGSAVFGSKQSKLSGPIIPGGPVIEVRARVIFGDVTIRPPRRRWW